MRTKAIYLCMQIAGLQVYLFRRLSDDLYKNHMIGGGGFYAMLDELMQSGHAKYNGSKNYIEFWNGSKIWLCHCQYEKDMYKYLGAEIHVLLIDELTMFSETIYNFLRGRCRIGSLVVADELRDKLPLILCGTNPGGAGHNWVKFNWIDKLKPLECERMEKSEGGMIRQFIPALMTDNPSLDHDYEGKLEGLGNPALVKAMRDGDWNIVAGGMFDDLWNPQVHVSRAFEIPYSWKINRGFDWGSSKPFAVLWFAESDGTDITYPDGTTRHSNKGDIYIFDEIYGWSGKPNEGVRKRASEIADNILELEAAKGYLMNSENVADSAIFTVENGNCIATDMEQRGVYWGRANKSPGSRINGWQLMRDRLENSAKGEDKGLYIFDRCRQTIRTIPVLPRDKRKADDIDTESEDHIADVIRYRCLTPTYENTVIHL